MRIKCFAVMFVAVILIASMVSASNMGFKLTMNLVNTGAAQNWFSLPYHNSYANAGAIYNDIGAAPTASVSRWNAATSSFETWNGRIGTNFVVTSGEGYLATMASGTSWVVVGSHDPGYSVPVTNAGAAQNWLSVPYHTTSVTAGNWITELEADLGGATAINTVSRWNSATSSFETYNGRIGTNFAITAGEAYLATATASGSWTPEHY